MDAYPDAKIILSVRDGPEKWATSIMGTMWRAYELRGRLTESTSNPLLAVWRWLFPASPTAPMDKLYWENIGYNHDPAGLTQLYEKHNEMIKAEAKLQGREVLEFNVKEGWAPLCEFLGVDVPEQSFPRLNNETIFTSDLDFFRMIITGIAVLNGIKYLGLAGASVAALRWYTAR